MAPKKAVCNKEIAEAKWMEALREGLKEEADHFYLLSMTVNGVEHIKIGVTGERKVSDRAWVICDRKNKPLPFRILMTLLAVKPRFDLGKTNRDRRMAATMEDVVKAILTRDHGGPVNTVVVDGSISVETFRCSGPQAVAAVSEAMASMKAIGKGFSKVSE